MTDPSVAVASEVSPASVPLAAVGVHDPTSPDPVPSLEPDLHWQVKVLRSRWMEARTRLIKGFQQKSGAGYPAAIVTPSGCTLARKMPNRALNGYVQVNPVVLGPSENQHAKRPWGAHQVTVFLHGRYIWLYVVLNGAGWTNHGPSALSIWRMLVLKWEVSHRCHQPTCITPEHLVVEPHDNNEERKSCKGKVIPTSYISIGRLTCILQVIVQAIIGGTMWQFPPTPCPHSLPCIFPIEERVGVGVVSGPRHRICLLTSGIYCSFAYYY